MNIPYLIWTFPYDRTTGGVKVLHRLCHELRALGHNAYLTTSGTNPEWYTPVADGVKQRKLIEDGAIVVYPEVVSGNPLHAKRVVRWILNEPGKLGGDKTYDPTELRFAFMRQLLQDGMHEQDVLYLPTIEPELFYPGKGERRGTCCYVGKAKRRPNIPRDWVEITREFPKMRKELAELFRKSERFVCFDNLTALYDESRICGCPTVIIPDGSYTRDDYGRSEMGLDGLAYGQGGAEWQRAVATVRKANELYQAIRQRFGKQLVRFVARTQSLSVSASPGRPKQHRIISLPVDEGGCGWYRVRQPVAAIKELTPHDAHVIDKSDDMTAVSSALRIADVVMGRQGAEIGIRKLKEIPEFKHLKYVMDIDDNVEMISPYSEHYREYGVEEFKHNGQWIWKDGTGDFDIARNKERLGSLLRGLQEADLVTVTTPKLAEYARQYNKNVRVFPNGIDCRKWWPVKVQHEGLRVGWSGGVSHYEDWYTIKESLNRLMRKHDFTLVMIGSGFAGLIDEDLRHRVEIRPWVPFPAHSYRMMCLGLDIALIPLADLPFNYYKSPIKLIEFSAMGVPSVVAGITPYIDEEESGQFFYDSPRSFETFLEALLEDPALREERGRIARQWVEEKYDVHKLAPKWADTLTSVL